MRGFNKKIFFVLIILPVLAILLASINSGDKTNAAEVCCYHECLLGDDDQCDGNRPQFCGQCDGDAFNDWCDLPVCGAGEMCSKGVCQSVIIPCAVNCSTGPGCRSSFPNADIDSSGECCGAGQCFTCRDSYHWDAASVACVYDCIDADNDGYGTAGSTNCLNVGVDCDDTSRFIYPGSNEACDNIDNNCNTFIDEGCDDDNDDYCDKTMRFFNYPVLSCPNTQVVDGSLGDDCNDGNSSIHPGLSEICDGLTDEDCDGVIDEGCVCVNGVTEVCGINTGTCSTGMRTCSNGNWGICNGEVPPSNEICDGLDNNCDGQIDEICNIDGDSYCSCTRVYAYGSNLSSLCADTDTSNAVTVAATCDCDDSLNTIHPGFTEVCDLDGIDNNCDGNIDENCNCSNGQTRVCGTNVGSCQAGIETCVSGNWAGVCAGEIAAVVEVCGDGQDNNCDGVIDEGCVEICDGIDNDGNGFIDEICDADNDNYCSCTRTYVYGSDLSTICSATDITSAATVAASCDCNDNSGAIHPGFTEVCNGDGIDNNCDGNIDEGCGCTNGDTRECGAGSDVGECEKGTESCVSGSWSGVCTGEVAPVVEVCGNGLDDNCDGTSDEGCGIPTSFDWRNYSGKNWLTEIRDQQGCGGCWAFATAGVAEAKYNIQTNSATEAGDPDIDLSEQYLISDCLPSTASQPYNCNGGWWNFDMDVPDENCYPNLYANSSCSSRCSDWSSRLWDIDDKTRITFSFSLYEVVSAGRSDDVKQLIMSKGPLWTAIGDAGSLTPTGTGTWRCTNDDASSDLNHAVILVGWNDAQGYWIIRNSWGLSHGDSGYTYIDYGECYLGAYYYLDSVVSP